MNWRNLKPSRAFRQEEDCLADFTTEEVRAAAVALDNGDQAPADALVARAREGHGRCVAVAVLQFVGIDASEVGR